MEAAAAAAAAFRRGEKIDAKKPPAPFGDANGGGGNGDGGTVSRVDAASRPVPAPSSASP